MKYSPGSKTNSRVTAGVYQSRVPIFISETLLVTSILSSANSMRST